MKNAIKTLAFMAAVAAPLAVHAADKADTPPQGTPVYPCWDMMKDGHMMQMRGTWHSNQQGHMMMMQQQDVQQMQQEIKDLRAEIENIKKK